MLILGLGCTAQVGKDTAAEYLEKKYPGRVKRVAFADKLKNTAMDLFGLSWEQCYGPSEIKETVDPRYNKSPRKIMQELGEKMREIYPDIWIDTVFYTTIPEYSKQDFDCFVISDVRYPNEGDGIHRRNGTVVKIARDGAGVVTGKDHASETSMLDYENFDFIIENNEGLDVFFEKLDRLMEEIYGRAQGQDNN